MTNKITEALKLAEEALKYGELYGGWPLDSRCSDALAAIRESLAEPVKQEPVAVVEITYGREPECYVTGNIDDFPEGVFKLYAAPLDAKAIQFALANTRAEALEEAAKVCDRHGERHESGTALGLAAAIRSLCQKTDKGD